MIQIFLALLTFLSLAYADDDVRTVVRHIQADPQKMGVAVVVSVEDKSGNPIDDLCSSDDDCKDNFRVRVSSSTRPSTAIHKAYTFEDYKVDGKPVGFDTVLLIDGSGSMHKYWDEVKSAAKSYIDGMNPQDRAAVYVFTDEVYDHNGKLMLNSEDDRNSKINWTKSQSTLKNNINSLPKPSGNTEIYKSLRDVIHAIRREKGSPQFRTIVLLTDGMEYANIAPSGSSNSIITSRAIDYETVLRWATDEKLPIPINSVQFYTSDLKNKKKTDNKSIMDFYRQMYNLSKDTKGRSKAIEKASEIKMQFKKIQNRVHKTWILETIVCDLPAGLHDASVKVYQDNELIGMDANIFMSEDDIEGAPNYCQFKAKDAEAFVTFDKFYKEAGFALLCFGLLVGGIFLRTKNANDDRQTLRIDLENLRRTMKQLNDQSSSIKESLSDGSGNFGKVETEIQSLKSEISRLESQLDQNTQESLPSQVPQQETVPQKRSKKTVVDFPNQTQVAPSLVTEDGTSFQIALSASSPQVTIGSDSASNVVVNEEGISSVHAIFHFHDGKYYIQDHNSTNGTKANDVQITGSQTEQLSNGSVIVLGITKFIFNV